MPNDEPRVLATPAGEVPLQEYSLTLEGNSWRILHGGAVVSHDDEQRFLGAELRVPYGLALWPSSIALAHDVASRDFRGLRVLELGAGTGLPGIVAASRGAQVLQTDRHDVALALCTMNASRNGVRSIDHREADWTAWTITDTYDCILAADVLYGTSVHDALISIFRKNLAPGGRVLLADPLRKMSIPPLEAMEAEGWTVTMSKWTVGIEPPPRAIGVYELTRG